MNRLFKQSFLYYSQAFSVFHNLLRVLGTCQSIIFIGICLVIIAQLTRVLFALFALIVLHTSIRCLLSSHLLLLVTSSTFHRPYSISAALSSAQIVSLGLTRNRLSEFWMYHLLLQCLGRHWRFGLSLSHGSLIV